MKKLETDVVVVAAGLSGLAAAATAAENGARVIAFEKASTVGGAANMGMGPFAVGTRQQQAMMVDIDVERAFKMFMDYTHWRVDAKLVKRYFENSASTIEWLEDMGVVFAGAYKYFPKSMATWHIVAVNGGIGRNGGAIMTKALMEFGKSNGVEFHLETPVTKIMKGSDGKICGVIAKGPDGEQIEVACKAVIVCTGGAGDNPQMIKERLGYTFREDMYNFAIPGMKGEGIMMAEEVGAAKSDMNIEMTYNLPDVDGGPECTTVVFMQPNLLVDVNGERFMDEEQMQNSTFTGNAIAIQKKRTAYSILDASILRGYKKRGPDVINFVHHKAEVSEFDGGVTELIKNGNKFVFKANTIRELAEQIGIDPDDLEETVKHYNEMCATADTQFYKSRKFMKPIVKAPFYAGRMHPSGYGTLGGIKINHKAEVLDKDWNPVPGLFAAGTDTCSIFGDSYMFLLPGNTMGYCLNTGRFAGESAAEYSSQD